jgi:hypothetical protein
MRLLLLACLLFGAGALRAQRSETDSLLGPPASRVQVFGSVADSLSGKPVYDALVELWTPEGKRLAVSSVNSDGLYAMFVPGGRPCELRITRENGYRSTGHGLAPLPSGSAAFRQDLLLSPR